MVRHTDQARPIPRISGVRSASSSGARLGAALVVWWALAAPGQPSCNPVPVECSDAACACVRSAEGIMVSEIMPRSWDDDYCQEWFEIYNASPEPADLSGWTIEDPTTGHTLTVADGALVVAAGAAVTIGPYSYPECDSRPSLLYWTAYSDDFYFSLGLYEGGVVLRDADGLVRDAVVWDRSWGFEPGRSLELVDPSLDNALRASWAPATEPNGWDDFTMYGTPRRVPAVGQAGELGPPCDDGNACTVDYCDDELGWVHATAAAGCDDGDECTTGDRCTSWYDTALCAGGAPRDCDDGDPCTVDWCDPGTPGGCRHRGVLYCSGARACGPSLLPCPDHAFSSNPCFGYVCSEAGFCELAATTAPCDDGDPCTVDDRCGSGRCSGVVPPRYQPCRDPDISFGGEGVCIPELRGFGYPISMWLDDAGFHHSGECGDCYLENDSPCGPKVCWEPTNKCMVLVRD